MRYLILSLTVFCLIIFSACGNRQDKGPVSLGSGRLARWSNQTIESSKKIIFIHGYYRDIRDPHGLTLGQLEIEFSPKLENLDSLGTELFGCETTELVEYWFYGYNPEQDISKIADDLANLIADNSNFNDAQIAVIGYSQGGVVSWLLDQQHDLIDGGVILAAPILSTPLAHKDIRDDAIKSVYPVSNQPIISVFDQLSGSVEHLQTIYSESGQSRSELLFMIGYIDIPSDNAWTRNVDLVDAMLAECDSLFGNISNSRQLLEIGSTLIDASEWDGCEEDNCFSDGIVPICSAYPGVSENIQLWPDYDHIDLLSGRGMLELDLATLRHLGEVLDLFPKFAEADLPLLPELEIHFSSDNIWNWVKFAYVINGQLFVTDEDWNREELVYSGQNYHPRFGSNNSLVWTNLNSDNTNICLWQSNDINQISCNNSWYANFSSSGDELIYQDGANLAIYTIESDEYRVVVQGIDLIAPPIWVKKNFSADKIYFANQETDGIINLYSISFNVSNQYLTDTKIVATNCSVPFIAANPFNGVAVISNINEFHQVITVVSGGILTSSISIDITQSDIYEISGTTREIVLKLPGEFKFDSMAFDVEYGHLYLIGLANSTYGLWLLDINRIFVSSNADWDEVFYLVKQDVTYLDIKLAD